MVGSGIPMIDINEEHDEDAMSSDEDIQDGDAYFDAKSQEFS